MRLTCFIAIGVMAGSACAPEPQRGASDDASQPPSDMAGSGDDDAAMPPPLDVRIHTEPVPAPPPPGEELPVAVVRTFRCEPAGVGSELVVAAVTGDPGAVIVIRPGGLALNVPGVPDGTPWAPDCRYQLLYRAADGAETVLAQTPSGFLFAAALKTRGGADVVCVNDLRHSEGGAGGRHIDAVTIACTARARGGTFGALASVVVPDGDWAAWLRTLAERDDADGQLALRYVRDFSFQFMNMSDAGRPATDGIFELGLRLGADGILAVAPGVPAKVGARTNPLAEAPVEGWRPDRTDRGRLREVFGFDDDLCLEGCAGP